MSNEVTTQVDRAAGNLLVGDLAVIALKALLENGVGWIVGSWLDRPTPIDAAIDDARETVLARQGVLLRRLRSASALDALVAAPVAAGDGTRLRGAVIFAGERGLRPTLERFVRLEAPAPIVGFCFDVEAARIEDAIVLDPAPTASALVDAVDVAFAASRATGRPALVLVRERMLGMRGTIRTRPNLLPLEGAAMDAGMPTGLGPEEASARLGIVEAFGGEGRSDGDVVVVPAALRTVALRAGLARPGGLLPPSVVVLGAPGIAPIDGAAARVLAGAGRVFVIEDVGTRVRGRIERGTAAGLSVERAQVDLGSVTGEDVERLVAAWLGREDVPAGSAAAPVLAGRVPARGEELHRAVAPALAAGLALAQGVIGVPARVSPEYPTYRTETAATLTIVPAGVFVEHGAAAAAPGTAAGVFVVTGGAAPGVLEAAAAIGASVEHVDGTSPRALGRAIALACRTPRAAPHVIIEMPVQRIAGGAAAVGVDHDLLGSERLAFASVDRSATLLAELGDGLTPGPAVLLPDSPAARAALPQVRELSPALHDVRIVRQAGRSRFADGTWMLRRRMARLVSGVDL